MTMTIKKNFLIAVLLISNITYAQKSAIFMGATAHLGNGEKIKNSVISVKEGKIDLVADLSKIRIDPSAFDTIHKVYGKHKQNLKQYISLEESK